MECQVNYSDENLKIAIFLRSARSALGWTQAELSERLGIAKSTLARIETLDMEPRADLVARALRMFKESGVIIDPFMEDHISFRINPKVINDIRDRLQNDNLRRTDRKRGGVKVRIRQSEQDSDDDET